MEKILQKVYGKNQNARPDFNNKQKRYLQEYFLQRHPRTTKYKLTEYAIEFYDLIKKYLLAEFNEEDTERIFNNWIEALQKFADSDEDLDKNKLFQNWIDTHFKEKKGDIRLQINAIERGIKTAMEHYRDSIQNTQPNTDIETFLKKVLDGIKNIGGQIQRLRSSYSNIDKLKYFLDKIKHSVTNETLDSIKEVEFFFSQLQEDLEVTELNLTRVYNTVTNFLSNLTHRKFEQNSERFLLYLLQNASVSKNNQVDLPTNISPHNIYVSEKIPQFIKIERNNLLLDTVVIPSIEVKVDKQKQAISRKKVKEEYDINKRVLVWVKKIETDLNVTNTLKTSQYLEKIIAEEKEHGVEIFIRFTMYILNELRKNLNYSTEVIQKPIHFKLQNIIVWEIMIMKK